MIVKDIINHGVKACEAADVFSGFARFLMLEILKENDLDMYLMMDEPLETRLYQEYQEKLNRVLNHEPMGYVLGYEWFYGYKIFVDESVLIPRQETEELVGHVLSYIDTYYENPKIFDVACGSGAIAIALSKELNTKVYASDISTEALETAKKNAAHHEAEVVYYQGDMLEPFIQRDLKVDVLVCNPPYIKNTEHVAKSVLSFEPHVALFGGNDGLYFYQKVLEEAHRVLNKGGMIAFEIGFDIGEAVTELAKHYFKDAEVECIQDLNGLDRIVMVKT